MRVKVGDTWYDGNDQPVMVELNEKDKKNIANMGEQTRYCSFPDLGYSIEDIKKWMGVPGESRALTK